MATGYINLPPGSAVFGDGTPAAPALERIESTDADPKRTMLVLAFDATADEYCNFQFMMPGNYASGGTLTIQWTSTSTTAGHEVVWGCEVSATTPADTDTPIEHTGAAAATVTTGVNTTEAGRLISSSITLTMDSAAADDFVNLLVYRDADAAADDATGDARVYMCRFSYTTS